ncbi:hypothetical protein [Tamlana sp. I1]|uniref:hypothetical protein n=1 Tax=Tamlana sp. I1 TaxID=2762061 RepID=UPI001890695E|nr:hypothetical protein [Tamlana sp. I1]
MIVTITLIISSLVVLNLLLLKFSSNKIIRTSEKNKKPIILRTEVPVKSLSTRLAPTGS